MGRESVFEAAKRGDSDSVDQALAEDPALAAAHFEHGVTLLHVAAERDDVPLARTLLDRGVDLEAEAAWGHTALEWAATLGSARVADHLIERGAERLGFWTGAALGRMDVVAASFDGDELKPGAGRVPAPGADLEGWPEDCAFRTGAFVSDAFYIACRNGHTEVAAYLLDRGADVDATGYFGAPALHWSALNGHRGTVEWLIEHGADPSLRDRKFDGTASGWADEGGHPELAAWLRARESGVVEEG